ncbi:hypothetical protein EXS73_00555 [Candidatus Pacearchaeota archaeon]|nr:hypothetical protein [Candidatus Pacearchaeota archaeon]
MKGQLKIQEMAFVIVALVLLFALIAVFFTSWRLHSVKGEVEALQEYAGGKLVSQLVNTPELQGSCQGCVSWDHAWVLAEGNYSLADRWNLDYLEVQILGVNRTCTAQQYPECGSITLIRGDAYGTAQRAFSAMCYWDPSINQERCQLGMVLASGGKA